MLLRTQVMFWNFSEPIFFLHPDCQAMMGTFVFPADYSSEGLKNLPEWVRKKNGLGCGCISRYYVA